MFENGKERYDFAPTRQRTGDAPPEGLEVSAAYSAENPALCSSISAVSLPAYWQRTNAFSAEFHAVFCCLLGRELCLNPHNHLIPKKNNAPRIKHPNSRPIYKPLIPLAFIRPSKGSPLRPPFPRNHPPSIIPPPALRASDSATVRFATFFFN